MLPQAFLILILQFLFCIVNVRAIEKQHYSYDVKSSQLNGWATINVKCLESNLSPTTSYDIGGPVAKRSIHDHGSFGPYMNDVSLGGKDARISVKDYHSNITYFDKEEVAVKDHEVVGVTNNNKGDKLLDLYESLTNNDTTLPENSSPRPTTPIIIENANFTSNHSKVLINFDCNFVSLGINSYLVDQHRLNFFSEGQLLIENNDWWKEMENLKQLKMLFESGFSPPSGCAWIPDSLSNLDLSGSPLYKLELKDCKSSLMHLLLSGSSLRTFSMCLPSLKELDASWNSLTSDGINLSCDNGAFFVKQLKLSNNQLTFWSSCKWPSLTELQLQLNKLLHLDLTTCPPRHLLRIDLSNNRLLETPERYPPKLVQINLSHNNLKKTTPFNHVIQEIDLSYNALTSFGKGTFRNAGQLHMLDLSHNKLATITARDFHGLRELRSLDLSHNSISHIRHESFHPMKRIQSINLNNNVLHQLDTRLLSYLPNNIAFKAFRNPWRCSCHLLASLMRLARTQCKAECDKQEKITCQEGHTTVKAETVLRQCIEAVQDISEPEASVHFMPKHTSDEDKSEEKTAELPKRTSYKVMAIACALILIVVPIMALAMKKLYKKRKSIKRMFNCLAPPNIESEQEEGMQRWSADRLNREYDSETEF